MAIIPWSGKPKIDELKLTHNLMREAVGEVTKNQSIPMSDVLQFIFENIATLNDGEDTRTSAAKIAFEEGGASFKGSIRPNPENQINVRNQAQLEAELGANLIIPDGERRIIVYDAEFTQTKPFQLGENSTIEIYGAANTLTIIYDFVGPIIKLLDPAKPARTLIHNNMRISGNDKATLYDLDLTELFFSDNLGVQNFVSLGIIRNALFVKIEGMGKVNCGTGIVFLNPTEVRVIASPYSTPTISNITALSVIYDGTVLPFGLSSVILDDCNSFGFTSAESLLFLDPNPPAGTSYIIKNCARDIDGNLFQPGVPIATDSVTDNGSGKTRFATTPPHGLVVGRPVVLSGHSDSNYNGTFIVTAVDTPLTGNTFDVDITIALTDSGTMNAKSLDSTDVLVNAQDNPASQNSMSTGSSGLEIFGSEQTVTINTAGVAEIITNANWLYSNLERFSEGTVNTGQLVTDDISSRRYAISYSATMEKDGGGSLDVGIVVLKNGVIESFNPPHSINTGTIQISGQDIIELKENDTIDIAVINYLDTANIIVSQASLVVDLA